MTLVLKYHEKHTIEILLYFREGISKPNNFNPSKKKKKKEEICSMFGISLAACLSTFSIKTI